MAAPTAGWSTGPPVGYPPVGRRRRRWPWVLLTVFVVLLGLLVAADRIAASIAAGQIADRLDGKNPFTGRPSVAVRGFPFLTQVARGTYSDIEVTGAGRPVGKLGGVQIDARMRGVHISLSDVTDRVSRVPVDRADVTISVPLAAVASASGIDGLSLSSTGDQITARAPVPIPGLGTVTVSATGRLVISSAGDITVDLGSLGSIGGVLPSGVQEAALRALGLVVPVENMPFQSVATSVRVESGTVRVTGTARDFVLQ